MSRIPIGLEHAAHFRLRNAKRLNREGKRDDVEQEEQIDILIEARGESPRKTAACEARDRGSGVQEFGTSMSRGGAEHAEKIVRNEHCNCPSAVTAAPRDWVFQRSNVSELP